jgi:hypothetical protein
MRSARDAARDGMPARHAVVPAAGRDDGTAPHAVAHLHALIATGLSRGFVTRGDIIDALPDDDANDSGVDAVAAVLGELGIAVCDSADTASGWTLERYFRPAPPTRAWADGAGALATADLLAPRTTDPVRLYLREMGTTPLLTRDEEFAYARRIERGRAASAAVLCGDPDALDALVSIRVEIAQCRTAASTYVIFLDDGPRDDTSADQAEAGTSATAAGEPARDDDTEADTQTEDSSWRDAVVARLARIDALAHGMRAALASGGSACAAYRSHVRDAAALLRTLGLSARALERMSEPLRGRARRHRALRGRLERMLADVGVPPSFAHAADDIMHRRTPGLRADADETGGRVRRCTRRDPARGPRIGTTARRDRVARCTARRDRARDAAGEGGFVRCEPATRRVDREALSGSRPTVRGPDPGRQHRTAESHRALRLPARFPVLDLRDLVDPAGDHACTRRPRPHDPRADAYG